MVTTHEAQIGKLQTNSIKKKMGKKENSCCGVRFGGSHAFCYSVFCAMSESQENEGANQKFAENWRSRAVTDKSS